MDRCEDNCVEYLNGSQIATFTFSQKKMVNKMLKFAESHPDEVDVIINPDGTMFGHIPVDWLKISPKRKVSEAQKEAARERLEKIRRNDGVK